MSISESNLSLITSTSDWDSEVNDSESEVNDFEGFTSEDIDLNWENWVVIDEISGDEEMGEFQGEGPAELVSSHARSYGQEATSKAAMSNAATVVYANEVGREEVPAVLATIDGQEAAITAMSLENETLYEASTIIQIESSEQVATGMATTDASESREITQGDRDRHRLGEDRETLSGNEDIRGEGKGG